MDNESNKKNISQPVYAFALAVMYILYYGYLFNTGDLAEHLPQVYRLLDPELYPGDFFLTQFDQTFTVREYWIRLVYFCSLVIGVEWFCFIAYLICVWLTILAWIHITHRITHNFIASLIAPLLIFFAFKSFTVGGNQFLENVFSSSIVAEALASWGFLFWLKGKPKAASALWGLACLMQLLVGLQWMMIFVVVEIILNRKSESIKTLLQSGLIFLLCASPMLIPIVYRQFLVTYPANEMQEFYRLLYFQRAPWHYIPHLFPRNDYVRLTLLLLMAWGSYRLTGKKELYIKPIRIAGSILTGCIIYFILIEWTEMLWVGKLQWFKTTFWLAALACIFISHRLADIWNRVFSLHGKGLTIPFNFIFTGIVLTGIFVLISSASVPLQSLQGRYHIGNYAKTDLQMMHFWIATNTPKTTLFLAPPDDESFACEAKRSMPVNYKALIHEPFYFNVWKSSLQNYYGVNIVLTSEEPLNKAVLQAYQQIHIASFPLPIDFRLDNLTTCTYLDQLGEEVHREGNWVLTRLPN
ncbi:MAG: DUF6798 domain-containing protein [Bacteroidia bacterium]